MPNTPLTNSRIPDSTYATDIADIVHKFAYDIEVNGCPRFTTTATRDTAYSNYVAAGGTLANGRSCWTDDTGYWDRVAGAWVARPTRTDVFGTSGNLSLITGWSVFPGYHTPAWYLSAAGVVTLSGMVLRTGADFALGSGDPYQFANIPAAIQPVVTASPLGFVGVNAPTVVYPARIFVANTSSYISVVGMDSGTGTMKQNTSSINFDGATYHL